MSLMREPYEQLRHARIQLGSQPHGVSRLPNMLLNKPDILLNQPIRLLRLCLWFMRQPFGLDEGIL